MAKRVRLHFSDALDAFLSDPRICGRLKPSTLRAYHTALRASFDVETALPEDGSAAARQ